MSTKIGEVRVALCDPLNPGFGYSVRLVDHRGKTLVLTSRDPETGADLLTCADALRVAGVYASLVDKPRDVVRVLPVMADGHVVGLKRDAEADRQAQGSLDRIAGPLRPPQYAAPKLTPIPADDPRAVALRAPSERSEATLCWNGSEVGAELTCGHCGHTENYDLWVCPEGIAVSSSSSDMAKLPSVLALGSPNADPIECKKCLRLWRPSRVVTCELVTDAAEIAKFRREYYGEGR
jgi:hypothetical protein